MPKLEETFFVPDAYAPTFSFRSGWNAFCCAWLSDRVRTCQVVYSPFTALPRPWTTASGRSTSGAAAILRMASVEYAWCVLNVSCVPPLKSIPRFMPRNAMRDDAGDDDHAGEREPDLPLP